MCGIFGIATESIKLDAFKSSLNQLYHRGPDGGDVYVGDGIYLGHRRLSIIDLKNHAKQPMISQCQKFVLSYNGEIYNYQELRKSLDVELRTSSDTEVLLELFAKFGVQKALPMITGMFSISLLDLSQQKLYLVRDRLGEKPLFYGQQKGNFYFSSELKPIIQYPDFEKKISEQALRDFFAYNYIPAPLSIFQDIYKLMPGEYLEYDLQTKDIKKALYWDKNQIISNRTSKKKSFNENVQDLDSLLKKVIKNQMISDVPLGAFLSGGIDSSLIVSIMKEVSDTPVKTFTVGFNEKRFNEAEFAKDVATHLQTDHHEIYVSPKDVLETIPNLAKTFDEPMADSSQLPTMLISQLIKKHVTVALSGDGGDELFGGYTRYSLAPQISKKLNLLPSFVRKAAERTIKMIPPSTWDLVSPVSGDRLHKFASLLGHTSEFNIYNRLITHWADDSPMTKDLKYSRYEFDHSLDQFAEKMMFLDSKTYLPDDILVKVDRSAMASSLETRAPFLDHQLYEFAWQLPLEHKTHGSHGKIIMKELLYQYVPKELLDRPKMGFGVPIENWLRTDLRDWAEDLLSPNKLGQSGVLDASLIRKKWEEHLSGKRNWHYYLWDVLVFQMWYEEFMID